MKRLPLLMAALASALFLAGPAQPLAAAAERGLHISFIDVEGGAATLMVTPAGESILVDCGWPGLNDRDPKRIQKAAQMAGVTQIDHYVTTHWHTDHYGGIEGLARLMPVRHFWDRGIPETFQDDPRGFPTLIAAYRRAGGDKSSTLKAGDTLSLRAAGQPLELRVVAASGKVIGEGDAELPISCDRHPAKPADPSDNAKSIALLLKFGRFEFLNCGDLTWNIEHKLVCPQNRAGKVDLWQVTHHGADSSNNPAVPEAIEPRCAVMVNGPRKGGSPSVVRLLKNTRSLEAFYQLHRNITSGPDDNAPAEQIVNLDENCQGDGIQVRLSPAGDRYTVSKGADHTLRTLNVR